jgi:4-alpha-glucanotransferase
LHNGGPPLDHHAVFMALAEHFHTTQWRQWPREFQSASNPAVALFASRHRQEIGFHLYVQFELDRQLESLAALTRAGRMQIGLYLDLALGSSEAGSDAWTNPELFVPGVRVGAPPDPYSATGQTWGFPPLHPLRLRESKYDYWIRVLRAQMAHAGMVRIDHVMGLFRQYWVPEGQTAEAGAYVRFPADDLLGILALESQRHGVIVIGEDLGTVPPEVPEAMRRRRMLSSKVVWFEREWDGRFKPAGPYPERALTTVTTHDLPPLNGLWTKRDLDIRREIGLITDDEASVLADRERRDELAALVQRLREEKLLEESDGPTFEELCTAVHAFAGRTRSVLFGVYLDDVAGEIEPVNIPGVRLSQYRSWSRRMRRTVESLVADPGVLRVLDEIRRARESR